MKEFNPSLEGTPYSPKQFGGRVQTSRPLLLLSVMAWVIGTGVLQAQNLGNDTRFLLMQSQAEWDQFYRVKQDVEQRKELERARIPEYNVDLSIALSRFQKHISDMQKRHVTCSICRDHVKRIRELARKIDQGMKVGLLADSNRHLQILGLQLNGCRDPWERGRDARSLECHPRLWLQGTAVRARRPRFRANVFLRGTHHNARIVGSVVDLAGPDV
ncbi:MAG: hypothetical protein ACRD2L_23010 [Terriglobia bacterium]